MYPTRFHWFFKLYIGLVLAVLLFLQTAFCSSVVYGAAWETAASEEAVSEITVSAGTFDAGKLGTYQPVTVFIPGSYAGLGGTAVLTFLTADSKRYQYDMPFTVTETGVAISFSVPAFSTSMPMHLILRAEDRILYSRYLSLTSSGSNELTIGILSAFPDEYNSWQHLSVSDTAALTTDIKQLTAETFPQDELRLRPFDVLIVEQQSLSALSAEQFDALCTWLRCCDVRKTLILSEPDAAQLQTLAPLTSVYSHSDAYPLENLKDTTGDEAAMLSIRSCGQGSVVETGFPLHAFASLLSEDVLLFHEFWDTVYTDFDLNRIAAQQRSFTDFPKNVAEVFTGQQQSAYISRMHYYSWILLLYLAVCAALTLLLFRKGRHRRYLRLTMSATALLFSVIIYFVAAPTRHEGLFMHSISLNEYRDTTLYTRSYNSIQAPSNTSFALEADASYRILPIISPKTAAPVPFQENPDQPFGQYLRITTDKNLTLLRFDNQVAFHPEYFQMERTVSCEPALEQSEIRFSNGRLTGTITSHLDHTVSDVVLMLEGILVPIGDLLPEQTLDLSVLPLYHRTAANVSELIQQLILSQAEDLKNNQPELTVKMGMIFLSHLIDGAAEDGILFGRFQQPQGILLRETEDFDSYYDNFEAIHLHVTCEP